jgi:hypothetical protein
MADIKKSALTELTELADGDMFEIDDVSELATEKTKRLLFSTMRKAALSDADADTKITLDAAADEDIIRFYTGSGGQQVAMADGSITPNVDNDFDIGSTTKRFKVASFVKYFMTSTFYATFPTNGVSSNSIIMTGNTSTIVWFYGNTAPPGWKVVGVGDYALMTGATGGITSGSWTISGLTSVATTGNAVWTGLETPAHAGVSGEAAALEHTHSIGTAITSNGTWRPQSYIGKLCLLDTA